MKNVGMTSSSYRYAIDYFTPAGEALGSVPVEPDWEPALEWTQFLGLRQQKLRAIGPNGSGRIEPVWDPSHGKPVLSAVCVEFPPRDGNDEVSAQIPITYFKPLAQEGSRRLVESGQLKGGDRFRYKVCAYLVSSEDRRPRVPKKSQFQIRKSTPARGRFKASSKNWRASLGPEMRERRPW